MTNTLGVSIPLGDLWGKSNRFIRARLDEVVALGATWLRTDVKWEWMEPTKGSISWYQLDKVVNAAAQRKLNVLLVVGNLPAWCRPPSAPTSSDQQLNYAQFFCKVIHRYKDRVTHYEMWNEANLPYFWPNPSPLHYADLTKVTYPMAKREDPNCVLLASGTGWIDPPGIDSVSWYKQIMAAGAGALFDIANVHPYQDASLASQGQYSTGELAKLPSVQAQLPAAVAANVWGTEFGLPTAGQYSVSEKTQADALLAGIAQFSALSPSGVIFLYSLRDQGGHDREGFFGLTRSDGTLKPAYTAIQQSVKRVP